MAYETKVILTLLVQLVGTSRSVKEVYTAIVRAANVEGLALPTYEEFIKELAEEQEG